MDLLAMTWMEKIFERHKEIVQQLLDRGADVNAQVGEYDNTLKAASLQGHEKVVRLLLYRGAHDAALGLSR
jgi:ankyrin repeat protein